MRLAKAEPIKWTYSAPPEVETGMIQELLSFLPQVEVRLAKAESKNWPALDRGGEQAAVGVATEQKPPAPYAGWVQGWQGSGGMCLLKP